MHEKGVVHRDMNPTNVFLQEDGRVVLLDFNVSKLIEKDQEYVKESENSKYKY